MQVTHSCCSFGKVENIATGWFLFSYSFFFLLQLNTSTLFINIRKRNRESVDPILLHCDMTSAIWSVLFIRFGISWVMPKCVIDLYDCWQSFGRPRSAAVLKMVSTCLFWCLWKERNDRNFEDRERSMGDIISVLFETLYLWTAAYLFLLSISFNDFLFRFALSSQVVLFVYFLCAQGRLTLSMRLVLLLI